METRAHYILIGAFMLSAIVLALLFTLWLGTVEREFDEYDVVFKERVSGLSEGSAVLFNGIDVGSVRGLKLAPNNPEQVIARVRVDRDTPIQVDTEAELELVGVTGLAVIQFSGGSPGAPLLKDVSNRNPPQIDASLSVAAEIIQGGGSIVASIQSVLSEDNIRTFGLILEDVELITNAATEDTDAIRNIVKNVETITSDVAAATGELDTLLAKVDTAVMNFDQLVAVDSQNSLAEFDLATAETLATMQDVRALLAENRDAIEDFTQQGLGEATGAIADTRRLIQTLDVVLREFERDPTRFFLGDARPEIQSAE